MDIQNKQGVLILNLGFLKPTYKIPIAQIESWKFVAEENGATYFSFHLGSATQHVSISAKTPEALKTQIQEMRRILGQEPEIEISQSRFPAGEILLAADIGIGVLGAVIVTMGGS